MGFGSCCLNINEVKYTFLGKPSHQMSSVLYDFLTRPELRVAVLEEHTTLAGLLDQYHETLRSVGNMSAPYRPPVILIVGSTPLTR